MGVTYQRATRAVCLAYVRICG